VTVKAVKSPECRGEEREKAIMESPYSLSLAVQPVVFNWPKTPPIVVPCEIGKSRPRHKNIHG